MHLFSLLERLQRTLQTLPQSFSEFFFNSKTAQRGFSLVELVVVAGIITIISTVLIARQSSFDSTILLRSLAYEVALSIRQAQIYGLSVKESGAGSGDFTTGYGVYFSGANPTSYILFADRNHNSTYDGEEESVEVFTMRRGYRLLSACGSLPAPDGYRCTRSDSLGELESLTISFRRPDPDARIRGSIAGETYPSAEITLLAPDGNTTRVISVESTGQIAVEQE